MDVLSGSVIALFSLVIIACLCTCNEKLYRWKLQKEAEKQEQELSTL